MVQVSDWRFHWGYRQWRTKGWPIRMANWQLRGLHLTLAFQWYVWAREHH